MSNDERIAKLERENNRLKGSLRYIAAQAKARHTGALDVIEANAAAALDEQHAAMIDQINGQH